MRTHHWLTAFLGGALLLASGKAEAQTPPGNAGYAQFNSHAAIDASGSPMGYTYPYPAISPFEHAFESTYNDRGQWITEQSNDSQNKYSFSVEAIFASFKGPSSAPVSYDGDPIPQMFFDGGDMSIDNNDAGRIAPGFSVLPEALEFNGGRGVYSPFDSGLIDQSDSTGLQLKFNVERPDGVGFELGGFGIWPSVEAAETGTPILRVGRQDGFADRARFLTDLVFGLPRIDGQGTGPFSTTIDYVDVDSVGAFNPGIRLNDGSELGTIQRFDTYFRTEMISELYGAHATILHSASRKIGPFTVRPVLGARYLNSKELFRVEGHDSSLDYSVDFENVNNPEDREALLPGGAEDIDIGIPVFPYRAYIDSDTETHLAGPEFGWQYAAGGEHFELVGETKIGVMGARQIQTLVTKGIGQPYLINQPGAPATLANPFYDLEATTFDKDATSYVTPTFQQSFNTTTRPFAYVPLVRSVRFFREANLKAGWTFLLIGQMQRPNEQIVYQSGNGAIPTPLDAAFFGTPQGDPSLIPEVKKDRSMYFVNYFNLGLEWEY